MSLSQSKLLTTLILLFLFLWDSFVNFNIRKSFHFSKTNKLVKFWLEIKCAKVFLISWDVWTCFEILLHTCQSYNDFLCKVLHSLLVSFFGIYLLWFYFFFQEAGLELPIFLPFPSKCWDYGLVQYLTVFNLIKLI